MELTRAGYCQHYAGAMALMLRMIGIPARVAVGFTAGTWKGGVWTVTDHQAHAWVEAWFAGHGWLAFDPTPGRGILSAVYTLASDSADAVAALGTGRFLDFNPGLTPPNAPGAGDAATPPSATRAVRGGSSRSSAIPLVALAAIVGVKRLRRGRRLRRREARELAAGVRAELVSALADRGAVVDPHATLGELGRTTQRVLALPVETLVHALAVARFGPPERARARVGRGAPGAAPRPRGRAVARAARRPAAERALAALVPARVDTVGTMRG